MEGIKGRKIRIGMVGCGRIAPKHFESFEKHSDDLEVVAVCDTNAEARRAAVDRTGAEGYSNLSSLLEKSNADAVVLATPSGLHTEQGVAVARAGKHVISEKPMATRWQDGKRFVRACDEAGVRLFVVKQNRKNNTIQQLKRAIEQGRFGRIYMVTANVFWARPQEYYDSAKWRGTWEFDGGAFMNQASHYVDLMEWLIGPVESVQAYTGTLARNIQVEDSGVLAMRYRNGALGSMNVTMLTYPSNFEGSITVLGEKGTVRVGGVALNEIETWRFADERPEDTNVLETNYSTGSVYGFGHVLYYDNVINALRGEAEPETDGREGLKSLELLIATYLSARDGQRVSLPLEY